MESPKIRMAIMEFKPEKKRFDFLVELELPAVPTKYDKITINLDDVGYIFKVHDVHFGDNGGIDVNVVRISSITEYYSSKYEYPSNN